MNIRAFQLDDLDDVKMLHEKHYKDEFSLPNFANGYFCVFVIEDDEGVLTIGGVRPIMEAVALTNKDRSPRDRLPALYRLIDACSYVAGRNHFNQVHAFIQDKRWSNRLKKMGLKPTKGESLVLDI